MKCHLPLNAFDAATTAIFYLSDDEIFRNSVDLINNGVLFAQVHGHLQINDRWIKLSDRLDNYVSSSSHMDGNNSFNNILDGKINDTTENNDIEVLFRPVVDSLQSLPVDPQTDRASAIASVCIFSSTRVPVSCLQLVEGGIFLEVELPPGLLSSYKSRSMSVDYYLSIYLQHLSNQRNYHFPFVVHSKGVCHIPYYTRYLLCLYIFSVICLRF
jgi:hypothetical protein